MEVSAGHRPYRRLVLRGAVATGVSNLWAVVVGIVTLPLLLGGLGTEAFGAWVLLQTLSVTTGWLSLGDIGLTTSITRAVAGSRAEDDHDRAAVIAVTGLTALAVLGVLWGAILAGLGPVVLPTLFRIPADLEAAFVIAIAWMALQTVADFGVVGASAVLEGGQRVDTSRGLDIVRRTLSLGGAAVAAAAGGDLATVAAVSAIGTVVTFGAAAVLIARGGLITWTRPCRRELGPLLRYGWSAAALRPIGVIRRTMDRLIVGAVLGPGPVALVEIATQIQNGPEAAVSGSAYAVTPSAAWVQARGDHRRLKELLESGTRYSLIVTLPIIVALTLLAGPLITVWLGPDQLDAVPLVLIALAYSAVTAPFQVGSNLLVGSGAVQSVVRAAGWGLAINLVLSLVLVRPFGPEGVFVATLISAIPVIPLLSRSFLGLVDLDRRSFVVDAILGPVRAAGVMAVPVAVVVLLPLGAPLTIGLAVALGGVTYVVAVLRWGLAPGELGGLLGALRGMPAVAVEPDQQQSVA